MSAFSLESLPVQAKEGLTCYLRHPDSGWVFRLTPWRDPDQPRFWCVRVDVCTSPSLTTRTPSVAPYYIALAMQQADLAELLAGIQSDPTAWLGQADQRLIRQWASRVVRTPMPPPPVLRDGLTHRRSGRSIPDGTH